MFSRLFVNLLYPYVFMCILVLWPLFINSYVWYIKNDLQELNINNYQQLEFILTNFLSGNEGIDTIAQKGMPGWSELQFRQIENEL